MKLNGAIKPQQESNFTNGSSIGAKNLAYLVNHRDRPKIGQENQHKIIREKYVENRSSNNNSIDGSNNSNRKIVLNKNTNSSSSSGNKKSFSESNIYKKKRLQKWPSTTAKRFDYYCPFRATITPSATIMRLQQSANSIFSFGFLILFFLFIFLSEGVKAEEDNFFVQGFSLGPDISTTEFDYASRGSKKFGDKCEATLECGFPGSVCDPKKKSCQCTTDLSVTNHLDKCGKEAAINESCFFNEQCEAFNFQTECRDGRCICRFEMAPVLNKDNIIECKAKEQKRTPERYVDPAMIGVLVGMALMFIIICVVLRLFSRARWRENRTIFNTPNPRLMNVSLLRENKLLHGQERRGSRMSVRVPSRQPSMASLRPHSPNPSLGKAGSRRESRGSSSNASATSTRSNRSNQAGVTTNLISSQSPEIRNVLHQSPQHQPLIMTNITSNPASDNFTVEIIETK